MTELSSHRLARVSLYTVNVLIVCVAVYHGLRMQSVQVSVYTQKRFFSK